MKIEKLQKLLHDDENINESIFNIYCDNFLMEERADEVYNDDTYFRWIQNHYIEDIKEKTLRKCFIIFSDNKIFVGSERRDYYAKKLKEQFTKELLKLFDNEQYEEILILEEI